MRLMFILVMTALLARDADAADRHRAPLGPYLRQVADIANLYAKRRQWDRALSLLDEVHRAQPDHLPTLEDLASACLRSEACAPRRLTLLGELIRKAPDPTRWLSDLVDELTRTGQRALAVRRLGAFVRQHPDDDAARALLVDTAVEQQELAPAIAQLRVLLAHQPDDVARRLLLCELLREDGQTAAFERELAGLARAFPDRPAVELLQIDRLIDRGQSRPAAERLRALLAHAHLAGDEAARAAELAEALRAQRRDEYADFRSSVGWSEWTDDLERR
jgi:predicted Zn-dependent protease